MSSLQNDQSERREYLLRALLEERPDGRNIPVPDSAEQQRQLLRALMNVRVPRRIAPEFLQVQDAYLQERARERGVVTLAELTAISDGLYLWQGDITRLAVDAIVNAANSGMTGCYRPNHACIDNCIHTYAGVQLRLECAEMMRRQGHEEPTGRAKLTAAYNLPCKYILHTVGPIITDRVTRQDEALLASCYRSCLELAEAHGVRSIAFCCISTGVFRVPNRRAAELAVQTVRAYRKDTGSTMEVIFNVFKREDLEIYQELLGAAETSED